MMNLPEVKSGAIFSPCRQWRYLLWRIWYRPLAPGKGIVTFIGLNPSTADEAYNDPTVCRCINYAKRWGYDGMIMANIFAYRSTDPGGLKGTEDPVGPANDAWLILLEYPSALIIAAWGAHAAYLDRHQQVLGLMGGIDLHCFGITKGGFPRHPLYLQRDAKPIKFKS